MNKVEQYMQRQYVTIVQQDHATDGTLIYLAYHPDLEGCMSQGDTIGEALANLGDARELYFETLLDRGLPIPEQAGNQSTMAASTRPTEVVWNTFTTGNQPTRADPSFFKIVTPSASFTPTANPTLTGRGD